jgi:Hg(II)-responsive transcriptional regulator
MTIDLTIGRLAKEAGVNIQTVRYYERRRLLTPALRRESGYRVYREDALQKLRFIKNAQELGFSLEEIRSLLQLRSAEKASCEKVQKKAAEHARDVAERIERLRAMERVLLQLVRTCQKRRRTDECPILRSLEARK